MSAREEHRANTLLARDAARLALAHDPDGPGSFTAPGPIHRYRISIREPYLQRLDEADQVAGPEEGWGADFRAGLRAFVAARRLPMLERYDVEVVAEVQAVADSEAELRERLRGVARHIARELTGAGTNVRVEIFPAEADTPRAVLSGLPPEIA